MKKTKFERYNLDKVYYLNKYNETIAYGKTNKDVDGVEEEIQNLELEKKQYIEKVANVVNPQRKNEEIKYHHYETWEKAEKGFIRTEILLIAIFIISQWLPIRFRTSSLFGIYALLLGLLVFFIVPLIFITAKSVKYIYGICYQRYAQSLDRELSILGDDFTRISADYYAAIDNLYLCSLDSVNRELVLMRRQQEAHNQKMLQLEKDRQRAEQERFKEQQRAREATEQLLAIEIEREERRRKNW